MNDYQEKYNSLDKEISVVEKDKQILEKALTAQETSLEDEEDKINDLQLQLFKLECEKDKMLNGKAKLINILIDGLRIIVLAGIPALAIVLFKTISPIGAASTLLTILGLTYGGVALLALELAIIKNIESSLKIRHANRIKNKKEYLQLMEKINNKQQELNSAKTVKKQLEKEINKLTSNINEQKEILYSKKVELLNLFQEILSATLKEPLPAETMWSFRELPKVSSVKKRVKEQGKNTNII